MTPCLVCGCTRLPGELHKEVIELGPRDNRGVILSVSIKCPRESCGRGGLVITSKVATKESPNRSISLDPSNQD